MKKSEKKRCVFFTLNYSNIPIHFHPAQSVSVRADASWRNELCGHKLRDRDRHCKHSKVIWPCNELRGTRGLKKMEPSTPDCSNPTCSQVPRSDGLTAFILGEFRSCIQQGSSSKAVVFESNMTAL